MRGQIALAVARDLVPEIIRAVRARPATAKADEIAAAVMPAAEKAVAAAVPQGATVAPVKPAIASKVNWTAFGTIIVALFAFFGLDLSPDMHAAVATIAATVGPVLIMVIRTWFTRAITRGSKR